jgi:hypothetical protein
VPRVSAFSMFGARVAGVAGRGQSAPSSDFIVTSAIRGTVTPLQAVDSNCPQRVFQSEDIGAFLVSIGSVRP